MSFNDTQKAKLVQILGRDLLKINGQLAAYADSIMPEIETEVIAQIARWQNGTVKGGVWFEGTNSNEGFNMSSVNIADNQDPKTLIEHLLFFETSNSPYEFSLTRG